MTCRSCCGSGRDVSAFRRLVYDFLATIPKGRVVTYSQLAAAIGRPGAARAVGNALHANPNPDAWPCHRVVDCGGRVAERFALGKGEQVRRLRSDGVEVVGDKVDLSVWQWKF